LRLAARSKPLAKKIAAWRALKDYFAITLPNPNEVTKAVANGGAAKLAVPPGSGQTAVPAVPGSASSPPAPSGPSPAMILNEKLKDAEFVFDVDDAGVKICYCKVGGRAFEGRGEYGGIQYSGLSSKVSNFEE
jgi:hypothetical protein